MSRVTAELPEALWPYLQPGRPALLLTVGTDGYPHSAYTWAMALEPTRVRFAVDHGSTTLANVQRARQAALQIIGEGELLYLIKGPAAIVQDRLQGVPFAMAAGELTTAEVRWQAWGSVSVTPLNYAWPASRQAEMRSAEQAMWRELAGGGS